MTTMGAQAIRGIPAAPGPRSAADDRVPIPLTPEAWREILGADKDKRGPRDVLAAVTMDPQAARLFVDWAMSNRGQAFYQSNPNLIYGSLRSDAPPMATGKRLRDFKLLFPADFADYMASQNIYNKEWNAMLGL